MFVLRSTFTLAAALLALGLPGGVKADEQISFVDAARAVMLSARYTALITIDAESQPRARVVDPFEPDENFVVWIATRPVTRKVAQIAANPRATLYYWDAEQRSYVTLMGSARLVDDEDVKKAKRREADSERFYPDFPDDYLLIKFVPDYMEGLVPGYRGDAETWKPETHFFKGKD